MVVAAALPSNAASTPGNWTRPRVISGSVRAAAAAGLDVNLGDDALADVGEGHMPAVASE
jgi:hypothetical protein